MVLQALSEPFQHGLKRLRFEGLKSEGRRDTARSGASRQEPDQKKGTATARWPARRTWVRVYSQNQR